MSKRDRFYGRYFVPEPEEDEEYTDEKTERKKVAWKEERRKQLRREREQPTHNEE